MGFLDKMNVAIGLLKTYMKHGVISEMTLTPLFLYFFESYPELTLDQKMAIFIDVTGIKYVFEYCNTWNDLEFPVDEEGTPVHPSFK